MKKLTKGFTLIELLVVIAIIGILSSIVLASLNTARQKARDAKRISDVKQIQLALELYADNCSGNYPSTLSVGTTCPTSNNISLGSYISVLPKDPLTSTLYHYAAGAPSGSSGCVAYHLGASLEVNGNSALNDAVQGTKLAGVLCGGTDFNVPNTINCIAGDLGSGVPGFCYDVANQ